MEDTFARTASKKCPQLADFLSKIAGLGLYGPLWISAVTHAQATGWRRATARHSKREAIGLLPAYS